MPRNMIIKRVCKKCGTDTKLQVTPKDHEKYLDGGVLRESFPYLSEAEIDTLLTSTCKQCSFYNRR